MKEFKKLLGTDNSFVDSIKSKGFEVPTEIQEKTIPEIIKGKDIIAGALTGSGKTFAFAVGLINNARKDHGIQGLVLTPTRELAEQVANEISGFSKHKDLDILAVYGGVSIINQIKRLSYADIVVGTPGRVLDHINRNSINLSNVNTLVLDEADKMLDMGFRDDVGKIISKCPKKRQTMLFSATISNDINDLAQKYMQNPIEISAELQVSSDKLEQIYYDVEDNLKYSLLKHLLENEKSNLVMIFCRTRKNVDFIANNLKLTGIEVLPIHGGFSQDKRNKILQQFHSNKIHVLVATDVAARGLDINGVSHVYNYDIPENEKEYTHRIGRTARAGKQGKVINILTSRDYENFNNILRGEFKIKKIETPFIKRTMIKWIPDRNNRNSGKFGRDNNRTRSFGGNRDSRGFGRDNRPGGYGNKSRFGRDEKDNKFRRYNDNRPVNSSIRYRDKSNPRTSGRYGRDNRFGEKSNPRTSGRYGRDNRFGENKRPSRFGGNRDSRFGNSRGKNKPRNSRRFERKVFNKERFKRNN